MKQDKNYLGRIKESVDFIYALVTENPDGYQGGFDTFTQTIIKKVARVLVKRGILAHSTTGRGKGERGCFHYYKWASDMAPTNVLYKSVMAQIREEKKAEDSKRYQSKKQNGLEPVVVVADESKGIPPEVINAVIDEKKEYVTTLEGFSAQELWDELKKRGYSIENNRLVIIKKAYLD